MLCHCVRKFCFINFMFYVFLGKVVWSSMRAIVTVLSFWNIVRRRTYWKRQISSFACIYTTLAYFDNVKKTFSVLLFGWRRPGNVRAIALREGSDPDWHFIQILFTFVSALDLSRNLPEYHIYLVSSPVLTDCQWIYWDLSLCMEMPLEEALSSFGCLLLRECAGIRKKLFSSNCHVQYNIILSLFSSTYELYSSLYFWFSKLEVNFAKHQCVRYVRSKVFSKCHICNCEQRWGAAECGFILV